MAFSLPVLNADTATFECTFGRGCEGICCQEGRPCTDEGERKIIQDNLSKFLPEMRPRAAEAARKGGFATNRVKMGGKTLRVVDGWCIFFNKGCVLHKVGITEGDAYKYKPYVCAIFPLHPHHSKPGGVHYVRQWGYEGEGWDLFCLNPKESKKKAVETLKDEIAIVARWVEKQQKEEAGTTAEAETMEEVAPKKKSTARKATKTKVKVTSRKK